MTVLLTICLLSSVSGFAETDDYKKAKDVKTEWVIWDLSFARPAGMFAIATGTTLFLLSLPFTLPSRSVKSAADKLIMDPLKFTFTRPPGQWGEEY
jgi:hypothetical protein